LIAILLGRLRMTVPQAIKAYNSLAAVLTTAPTEAKEERELNMTRFHEEFQRVMIEMSHMPSTPMRVRATGEANCKM
jgi:hypothetical protein